MKMLFLLSIMIMSNNSQLCKKITLMKVFDEETKEFTNYIDKGSFGVVKKDALNNVYKEINPQEKIELSLLNNEVKVMIAFKNHFDMMTLKNEGCFYYYEKSRYRQEKFKIGLKMNAIKYKLSTVLRNIKYYNGLDKTSDPEEKAFLKSTKYFYRLDMAFKLLTAFYKMQALNIQHLDLKPDNVFMMNAYIPMIGDFGFAKLVSDSRTFFAGTKLYADPQTMGTYPYYNIKNDVYTMGLMVIEILRFFEIKNLSDKRNPEIKNSYLVSKFLEKVPQFKNYASSEFNKRPDAFQMAKYILKFIHYLKQTMSSQLQEYLNNEQAYYNFVEEEQEDTTDNKHLKSKNRTTHIFMEQIQPKFNARKELYTTEYDEQKLKDFLNEGLLEATQTLNTIANQTLISEQENNLVLDQNTLDTYLQDPQQNKEIEKTIERYNNNFNEQRNEDMRDFLNKRESLEKKKPNYQKEDVQEDVQDGHFKKPSQDQKKFDNLFAKKDYANYFKKEDSSGKRKNKIFDDINGLNIPKKDDSSDKKKYNFFDNNKEDNLLKKIEKQIENSKKVTDPYFQKKTEEQQFGKVQGKENEVKATELPKLPVRQNKYQENKGIQYVPGFRTNSIPKTSTYHYQTIGDYKYKLKGSYHQKFTPENPNYEVVEKTYIKPTYIPQVNNYGAVYNYQGGYQTRFNQNNFYKPFQKILI